MKLPYFVSPGWAALFLLVLCRPAGSAPTPDSTRVRSVPEIRAARIRGGVRVDGVLSEPAWASAQPCTTFTQLDPDEGKPASERTEVRVLVGDDALYIGARMFDREPSKIKAKLARRDDPTASDDFTVMIDSYHDHLTARLFRVNPAGAIVDGTIGPDGSEDDSWDAVWEARARVDAKGWTAEMRIPLSQLRYHRSGGGEWGIQFVRSIFRRGETSYFAFTPKKEEGGVSRYGNLLGMDHLPEPRRLELLPYTVARNERLAIAPRDPFRSPSDYFANAGMDLKYGVTSDLTLDLTVNPDFGQVEVDPAEVNLTAFETFFPEHRPFFVEGADLFQFGHSRAFNNFGVPTIFHSRRIGRAPQLALGGRQFGYLDVPDQTTIAEAAKLTGRTPSGWAVGALDAITTREQARYLDTLGVERLAEVEPRAHYFAARVRRDLRAGDTSIGGLLTAVNRQLDDPVARAQLRSDAYVGGLDVAHAWGRRRWAFDADVSASTIRGSAQAIAAAQRFSDRYYQRPDHGSYARYDPTRTRLSGFGADASIAKRSGEHWLGSLAYVDRSPGYEANDLGFETRADFRGLSSIVLFVDNHPNRWYRSLTAFPYMNQMWNYGGDLVYDSYAANVNVQLANFWTVQARPTLNLSVLDDRLTRGGPQARTPRNGSLAMNLESDSRRTWSVSFDYTYAWNDFGGTGHFPSVSASFRPSPTLRLRFEPSYSVSHSLGQYVTAVTDPAATATYGRRYVFATLDQNVMSLVTRLDWTLTPKLSFQLYVQPLVVAGDYSSFKEFRGRQTFQFDVYGHQRGSISRDSSGVYTVDPGNGASFRFRDPNFNFRSLLGNAVLRWEYSPGSTLYFVWQQSRTDVEPFGDFQFGRDYSALIHHAPENVFAVKATWWLGL